MIEAIPFTKMHGLGNCYIYLDGFKDNLEDCDFENLAIQVSNPHTGIGSDGLIAILPSKKGVAKMRIFNKDGSEGKNCGNGLRCVARYIYEKGYIQDTQFQIETASGRVTARIHLASHTISEVTVNMGKPILNPTDIPLVTDKKGPIINDTFEIANQSLPLTAVSMGNPHAIFFVNDMEQAPIQTLGPLLADGHDLFPEGVNVGFVQPLENGARYRVWERGSGITEACGTGACAAAVAMVLNQYKEKDTPIVVQLDGGKLTIKWDSKSGDIFMTGPAEFICEGEFYFNKMK